MKASLPVAQCCDQCGHNMLKAHRVYHGVRICSSCYPKVFERRQCPACEQFARLPKADLSAVCTTCENDVPCARCGKIDYVIGKVTLYGPVCRSCSVYFRPRRTVVIKPPIDTTLANVPSDILSAASSVYATCRSCRRHRIVASYINRIPMCKACSDSGPISCPLCGCKMPAGRGKRCAACYWTDTFFSRANLDEAGLSTPQITALFKEFCLWLINEVPKQIAAQSIHRYFLFFYEIDKKWGAIPSYKKLLDHFNAEGLRRVRLPMCWLAETSRVVVDANLREQASEHRRIKAITSQLRPETMPAKILLAYRDDLLGRMADGKITVRSARLSLQPAAALLGECEADGVSVPGQLSLNRYLARVPGQQAGITGFVGFINSNYGAGVNIEHKKSQAHANQKRKLEADLVALISAANTSPLFQGQWLSVALAYFYGLPRRLGKRLEDSKISVQTDGNFYVTVDEKKYWVPRWNFNPSATSAKTQ